MLYIVAEQALYTAPSLAALRPVPKKRKLHTDSSDDSSSKGKEDPSYLARRSLLF